MFALYQSTYLNNNTLSLPSNMISAQRLNSDDTPNVNLYCDSKDNCYLFVYSINSQSEKYRSFEVRKFPTLRLSY